MSDTIQARLLFIRRYGGSDAGNGVERELVEHFAELQKHMLPSNCSLCGGDGGKDGSRCIRCGGWTQHKRLVAAECSELRARAERAERERDELLARLDKWAKAERRKIGCGDWEDTGFVTTWARVPEGEE
jgi:hypothetical protein